MNQTDLCPCGSGKPYEDCCARYIVGGEKVPTAEALMRSRYSAYAKVDIDYLYKTSSDLVRKEFDRDNTRKWAETSTWGGIEVLRTEAGGPDDTVGLVEFIAHYSIKETDFKHHEIAQFARSKSGDWIFQDGQIVGPEPIRRETPKIGRNDPCPCGSGKKYKKCCGKTA